ncbi:transcriptional regulator [candidate division KSB1 bacterium]|nr:transcriptional regulator [candidate division KSB1 bacterium]
METMTTVATQQITQAWGTLQALIPVSPIRTEEQYDQAVEKLNELLDIVGDNEAHPLYELLDTLSILIHAYDEAHFPISPVTGIEVLKFIMEEHQLAPSDLPEIGDEKVVTELLADKRELSVENIRALSKRFGVSPAVFIDG